MSAAEARQAEQGGPPSLLGRFDGERPPAAAWFEAALAVEPERSTFRGAGVDIETLVWGEVGKPGLLFLHGNGAHADWWSFIAPFFANEYRCAAISWSGMGGSGWREHYSIPLFVEEMLGAIDHASLGVTGPPLAIGHSFGGIPLMHSGVSHPEALGGGIMVDSYVAPRERKMPVWAVSGGQLPRYRTMAEALARYRFAPLQGSDHPEIVDHLARGSIHWVEAEREQPAGWTWRFDPRLWATLDRSVTDPIVEQSKLAIGLIYGERSSLVTPDHVSRLAHRLPNCRFVAAVPEAQHHIMADQPLALVAALRVGLQALRAQSKEQA